MTVECKGYTAAQQAGIAYEKKCAEYLKSRYGPENVLHNPWIQFADEHGTRWAQPDIIIIPPKEVDGAPPPLVIVECKLTYTKTAAKRQLRYLYYPLVKAIWEYDKNDFKLVQACKNLKQTVDRNILVDNIKPIVERANRRQYEVWNWRPKA